MEAAVQAEKRGSYEKAAGLVLEALVARTQTVTDVKVTVPATQRKFFLSVMLVLYSWAFRFIRESSSDLAFSVLKMLSTLTSSKSGFQFKGKRAWRVRVMTLYAWYYTRVSKFHAAMDYIDLAKQHPGEQTELDRVVLTLLEGFVLSNLGNFKGAVAAHTAAHQLLSSLPQVLPSFDDIVFYTCLSVSLFNLSADHLNLYQPQEAQRYILSASQVATSSLPHGSFARDKITSLYTEIVARPNPQPSDRSTSRKRPLQSQIYGSNFKMPVLRTSRRYSSSIRQRPTATTTSSARPTSASIVPASPQNSKSTSIKPHRKRRFVREKSAEEYEEVEKILRSKAEIRCITPEGVRPLLTERRAETEEISLFTVGREQRKGGLFAVKHTGIVGIKAVKIRSARRIIANMRLFFGLVPKMASELRFIHGIFDVVTGLKEVYAKRHAKAALIQRHIREFLAKNRLFAAYANISRIGNRYFIRNFCNALRFGRKKLSQTVICWQRMSLSLAKLSNQVLTRTVSKEMKDLRENLRLGNASSTDTFTPSTSRAEVKAGGLILLSEEWIKLLEGVAKKHAKRKAKASTEAWKSLILYGKQQKSAVVLQSFLRMAVHRRRYFCLLQVVAFLQAHLRAWLLRRRATAAVRVQRQFRSFCGVRRLRDCVRSAVVVQKYVRGFLARRAGRRRNVAANTIQRALRKKFKWLHALKS